MPIILRPYFLNHTGCLARERNPMACYLIYTQLSARTLSVSTTGRSRTEVKCKLPISFTYVFRYSSNRLSIMMLYSCMHNKHPENQQFLELIIRDRSSPGVQGQVEVFTHPSWSPVIIAGIMQVTKYNDDGLRMWRSTINIMLTHSAW